MRAPLPGFRLCNMNELLKNEMACIVLAKPCYIYRIKDLHGRYLLFELALKCMCLFFKFASVYVGCR